MTTNYKIDLQPDVEDQMDRIAHRPVMRFYLDDNEENNKTIVISLSPEWGVPARWVELDAQEVRNIMAILERLAEQIEPVDADA